MFIPRHSTQENLSHHAAQWSCHVSKKIFLVAPEISIIKINDYQTWNSPYQVDIFRPYQQKRIIYHAYMHVKYEVFTCFWYLTSCQRRGSDKPGKMSKLLIKVIQLKKKRKNVLYTHPNRKQPFLAFVFGILKVKGIAHVKLCFFLVEVLGKMYKCYHCNQNPFTPRTMAINRIFIRRQRHNYGCLWSKPKLLTFQGSFPQF